MNLLGVIFSILLTVGFGYSIIGIFSLLKNENQILRISISYGLGVGLIAILMFLYSIFSIPWKIIYLLSPIILIFLFFIKTRKNKSSTRIKAARLQRFEKALIFLLVATLLYVLFESVLRPIPSWDGWAAFYFHGKAFYIEGFINTETIRYSGVSNPPLTSLFIAFVYNMLGGEDDKYSLLLFSAFYLSLIGVFYSAIRKHTTRLSALLFTFLLASTPNLMRHAGGVDVGHADLILGYYILATIVIFVMFMKVLSIRTFVLLQIFLSLASLVKGEGFAFFIICQLLLAVYLLIKGKYKFMKFMIIGTGIAFAWVLFGILNELPQNPFFFRVPNIERLTIIILPIFLEFLNFQRWGLIWITCIILLTVKKYKVSLWPIFSVLVLQFCIYIGVYLTTPQEPLNHIAGSFDRLLLHLLPLFFYITVVNSNFDLYLKNNGKD